MTSVATRREQDDSGEYSDASQEIEHNTSGNDGAQHESDYDSRGSDSEHSDREDENQEGQTERRVDDDEDRSNPQYIPKRGTFYEHDDRTAASGEESNKVTSDTASEKKEGSETPSERRRAPRKSETINKWSHDKYNENEQMPKSRDELVAIYGYDIRNEDAPPHARRNRRYGRGPNKYTRTWEDEEAYKRQTAAAAQHRKPPNPEDFPELDPKLRRSRARPRSKSQPASNESSESGSQLRRNASIKAVKPRPHRPAAAAGRSVARPSPKQPPVKDARDVKDKMPALENLTITANVFNNSNGSARKVSAAVAQQRPVPTEQARRRPPPPAQPPQTPHPGPQPSPGTAPSKPQQQGPLQQHTQQQQKTQQNQQAQQTTAGTEQRGGSKRYSSLRQRPLAETYSPQTPQQQQQQQQKQQQQQQQQQPQQQPQQQGPQPQPHRYHGDYVAGAPPAPQHQGSPVPQIHPQQMIHQVHRSGGVAPGAHGPSPPHALPPLAQPVPLPPAHLDHQQQQVRLGILEQPPMVTHPHHGIHQPHSMGQLQPAQGYAPPAIMPAQYMQQQSSSSGVYPGALYQSPPAYPHQMYPPHHNYVGQATQAGGVTYYSCAEQEQLPRAQRRPTAAIPIVRPAAPDRPANSTEKDNIDRIVENMFVRKPWPATHGAESKDAKPDRGSQEPASKECSQPDSLTSSSISTDSRPEPDERPAPDDRPEQA